MRHKHCIIHFFILVFLTSCSLVTKPQIIQGNVLLPDSIKRLHVGMTPPEVVDVMGTPVLNNIFSPDRIEYVYTYQDAKIKRQETRVSCLFVNNRLKTIQTSGIY